MGQVEHESKTAQDLALRVKALEAVLTRAFAHRAVRRQADTFREPKPARFRTDELARQIVARGLRQRRNGI